MGVQLSFNVMVHITVYNQLFSQIFEQDFDYTDCYDDKGLLCSQQINKGDGMGIECICAKKIE